ncbi:MAG: OmpH family outer membrane protein [Methylacidiphilales bacterium]|nr:OmpH family outer membrane protein [Candidatus Methylacidiphilales bacterium]
MNKLLLLCLLVLAPISMASADLKVAVIDLGKAFDSYYKTKDAEARIKEKEEAAQKDLTDLTTEYENMQEEAKHLYDASHDPTLSPAAQRDKGTALQQKQQDLITLQNKIQETKVEREREIQDEVMRRHKEILDEITKVVDDYSGPQGFDIVVDKSSASASSGLPVILFNSSKLTDITDEIIRQLNLNAPPATAGAPSGAAVPSTAPVRASP